MKEIHIDQLLQQEDLKKALESFIEGNIFHVRFLFTSSFVNAKSLRDIADTICFLMWLDSKWKTRIVLIVDELNNNAIEYGSKEGDDNALEVYIEKSEKETEVRISVQDSGNGPHAKTASEMEELRKERLQQWFADHSSIRGRGLFMIITSLVDTLYFKDSSPKGLIVGIKKKLQDQE